MTGSFSGAGIPNSVLDDCCLRFLVELDSEDLKDSVRVFFKIEEAHWFYLDHFCESNPILPKVALRDFTETVCRHFIQLQRFVEYLEEYWKSWKQYKASIPTAGAILLDETLEYVLVLESFPGRRWGFPKGKKNNNESMQECAIREVLEETGLDITNLITPDEYLELAYEDMFVQLFIVAGISKDTHFQPLTRGEVKSFEWMLVRELPGATGPQHPKYKNAGFFMIRPFVNPLRRWIEMNRKATLAIEPAESPQPASLQITNIVKRAAGVPRSHFDVSESDSVPFPTPAKTMDLPLSVQKLAANQKKRTSMEAKEVVVAEPLNVADLEAAMACSAANNMVDTLVGDHPDGVAEEAEQPARMTFLRKPLPVIEFPDFTPSAWSPGCFKLDMTSILAAQ
ncbi:hypothetical protein RvY_04794 [Ramazzottius varieornatus]|uniref:mRNA-decapping enzyme 2 n=1 Tax=Ramazzottius varieornatus TaxID=947166 RepID=A0A1D1UTG8_RAMVA|nr:hypothetical protein RvY_04794 [Ramazzottius varieornatus]